MKEKIINNQEKYIICSACKGHGEISNKINVNYHNGNHDIEIKKCSQCGGYGTVIEITNVKIRQRKN